METQSPTVGCPHSWPSTYGSTFGSGPACRSEIVRSQERIKTLDRMPLTCTARRVSLLVLILCFCDPRAANFVLQVGTLQSEPLGRSSSPRDSSPRSTQCVDDHA